MLDKRKILFRYAQFEKKWAESLETRRAFREMSGLCTSFYFAKKKWRLRNADFIRVMSEIGITAGFFRSEIHAQEMARFLKQFPYWLISLRKNDKTLVLEVRDFEHKWISMSSKDPKLMSEEKLKKLAFLCHHAVILLSDVSNIEISSIVSEGNIIEKGAWVRSQDLIKLPLYAKKRRSILDELMDARIFPDQYLSSLETEAVAIVILDLLKRRLIPQVFDHYFWDEGKFSFERYLKQVFPSIK
jgi:hypothetical protein